METEDKEGDKLVRHNSLTHDNLPSQELPGGIVKRLSKGLFDSQGELDETQLVYAFIGENASDLLCCVLGDFSIKSPFDTEIGPLEF